ncbi:rhomboid family intramembrane serine protease [Bartonella sp. B41]
MTWLLVFGSPLARHFGNLIFLLFWVIAALVSSLTYFIFHQDSMVSLVGASGVVLGMMGAVARYGFFPIYFNTSSRNARFFGSLKSIKKIFFSKIVLIYISVWFIVNFTVGTFSHLFDGSNIPIAWEANIGGFFKIFVG